MIRITCLAGVTLPLLICACSGGAPASPAATSGQDLSGSSRNGAREDGGEVEAHHQDGRDERRDGGADRDDADHDRDAAEHEDGDRGHDRDADEREDVDCGHDVGERDGDIKGDDDNARGHDEADGGDRGHGGPGPH